MYTSKLQWNRSSGAACSSTDYRMHNYLTESRYVIVKYEAAQHVCDMELSRVRLMAVSAMQVRAQKCSSRNWHCKIRKRSSRVPHTWRTARNCSHRFCAPWWNQVNSACATWNSCADSRNTRLSWQCAAWSCGNAPGSYGVLSWPKPPTLSLLIPLYVKQSAHRLAQAQGIIARFVHP